MLSMATVWFCILVLCAGMYAVFDGFDFGAGMLHRIVAKNAAERRTVLAAIGPYWDGNEVWLLALGGVLFCAFPSVLGAALSGLYLAVFHILWALLLRGISIEFRSHVDEPLWQAFWDSIFQLSSLALAVLFGAALGTLIRGFAIDADGVLDISLFDGAKFVDENGILDGFTILVGVFVTATLASHGALFLAWKTVGDVEMRSRRVARISFVLRVLLWGLAAGCTFFVRPDLLRKPHGFMWLCFAAAAVSLGASIFANLKQRPREAFILSGVNIFALLAMVGAASFPELLHARSGASYLVQDSATPSGALATGLKWWIPSVLLVGAYFTMVFRFNRGKTRV